MVRIRAPWRRAIPILLATIAVAAPASAAGSEFRALSDTREVPTVAEAAQLLRALKPSACPRGGAQAVTHISTRRALTGAKRFLRKRVPRKAYGRFVKSRRARKPAVVEDLAIGAVVGHSPAGALAGFLAAHDREARNPRHLLNAASMLTRLGKPREALALIAAAERMPRPRRMPMGIGVRPLALNARGFALIALRRYREAEHPLVTATRLEPLLAEAKLNLAAARLCGDRLSQAIGPYIAGQRRRAMRGGVETAAVQPPAAEALDLSFGRAAALPITRVPPTPDDGAASASTWKQAQEQRYAEVDSLFQQANAALQAMSSYLAPRHLLEQRRALEILAIFNERYTHRPDLKAKKDSIVASAPRLEQIYADWQNEYQRIRGDCQQGNPTSDEIEACVKQRCPPATASAHSRWLEAIREADQMTREWANDLFRHSSGLAANYSGAPSQRAIVVAARHEIMAIYASHVVLQISTWTDALDTLKDECTSAAGEAQGEEGAADMPFPDLCPPGLAAVKFAFSIGFASFGVNCEAVSVELSLPKPVSPFVQVNYGFASGTTSVFAGAKAGGKIPGVSGGVRAGVTMTFDSSGNMTDVGLRGQASAAGPGLPNLPGTAPKVSAQIDYSLADSFL